MVRRSNQRGFWSRTHALWVAIGLALALLVAGSPASAHQNHKKKQAEAARMSEQGAQPGAPMMMDGKPAATSSPVGEVTDGKPIATSSHAGEVMDGMDMGMDRSRMSFIERLVDWFGRLHPMVVHFPIAFFPAALITAIAGKRRPSFATPVQFLVVAGGIFAPIAAGFGWFAGISSDPGPILTYHRWLGVAIGAAGGALGVWAWRRPWEDRGAGMILALTIMTVAIAVQGFLGAGLTHGMDHMMF